MARRVVVGLELLLGDAEDAPLVSFELLEAPLVLSVVGDVVLGEVLLGEVLLGEVLLGDMPFGDVLFGDVLLDASDGVVLLGEVVVPLPDVVDPLVADGWLRLTSPADVPVTVPLGAALLLGMQSVVIEELDAVVLDDGDMPLDVVLGVGMLPLVADTLPLVDARAAVESAFVDAVTPVPLAPFVVFGPVKRCSGFVAVLRVESVAPVVDVALGLIVVVVE